MARWTDAMKLSRFEEYRSELQCLGVYEIGYIQNKIFYPKYIGKASEQFIYDRIKTYGRDMGKNSHNSYIKNLIPSQFNQLYFHVIKMNDPNQACIREALLMIRHGRGSNNLYEWNNRYEIQILFDSGYIVT